VFANWQKLTFQGEGKLRSANMHLNGGRVDKALPLYEAVLEENSNNIEALVKIAGIYFDVKNDYLKANEFYSKIIEKIDGKFSEYEELKIVDKKTANKFYKKEIKKFKLNENLELAIKIKSHCWTKLFIEAQNNFQNEDYENALKEFQIVYEIAPDSIKTIKMLSYVYTKLGNNKKSLEFMIKAVEVAPDDDVVRTQIANTYFENGDYTQAIEWYKKATKVNPKSLDNFYNIAIAYTKAKNDSGAYVAFKKVVELEPENINAIINVSNLASNLGYTQESIDYLKKAVELEPKNISYLQFLCGKLYQEKKYDELIDYGQKWYSVETGNRQIPAQYVYQSAKSAGNKEIEKKFEKILRELQ